ncbi:polysaccharide biosynthesis protein [Terribacillus sp. DMT04]|uniref:polysaccharide biosynthesis protein n=1 Tax=Terribacillus sp. DMT04 TaxID=2850441 RepID=UPI001C2BC33E|nr:polysaccharide biosynthesis protein [Terribacillus sp. DMT04]QXE03586.1 polysaccharide biosynthesis protein [Terribacillus sp. DMT04]
MFKNKVICITGGTGSWGYELVRQLLAYQPTEIRIFSRNESRQFQMKHDFNNNPTLKFIIGDIRDQEALFDATNGVNYLFHLAALKHVPVCEEQPLEALKTNVIGTQHVIDTAIRHNIDKVIYISTDKAADPSNFYGLTKAMGERLIVHANTNENVKTKFICIRGGNVLGTNGSVIHLFDESISKKEKLKITNLEMTRFFMTVEDAIQLVLKATFDALGGEIFIMKMPAIKITELATVLMKEHKIDNDFEIIGIRPGEKIHEVLLSDTESLSAIIYDDSYFVILPVVVSEKIKEHYRNFNKVEITNYSSSQNLLKVNEIKGILVRGGFI